MPRLHYVPKAQFDLLDATALDPVARTQLFADLCRINVLYAVMRAGSGHLGTSFSSLEIMSWVYLYELSLCDGGAGRFFSSKGHDAPAQYAVLAACGVIDFDLLHHLRRAGGLPGHPDVRTPGMEVNSGSLGMGISRAKGFAEADRLAGRRTPTIVLTGDGELQEGQVWESLQGAANRGLGQITVVVDHNKMQSDTWVQRVSDLGDLELKFAAFGWRVARCDGHDVAAIGHALRQLRHDEARPGVLIADTVKGRGVTFMEPRPDQDELYGYHSGAPDHDAYTRALGELQARCEMRLAESDVVDGLRLEAVDVPERPVSTGQRLVSAYSRALVRAAERDERIVALDGDLVLDTGLVAFSERFPERFVECGIAEQDMVSQAGAMALQGCLPVVHSFASFLSTRPAEQVFANATEGTRVVYVGSLAGLVPGGPGHSHQSVRDVALFGSVPGLIAAEPCHESEVAPLLDVCLSELDGSVYLRLVTPPVPAPYELPKGYRPVPGRGVTLRRGTDGAVIGAGPVVLSQAFLAAEELAGGGGPDLAVVDLPWLNVVDRAWLLELVREVGRLVLVENHQRFGGQGQAVLAELARAGVGVPVLHLAVDGVPACGSNDEVLAAHGLDAAHLVDAFRSFAT